MSSFITFPCVLQIFLFGRHSQVLSCILQSFFSADILKYLFLSFCLDLSNWCSSQWKLEFLINLYNYMYTAKLKYHTYFSATYHWVYELPTFDCGVDVGTTVTGTSSDWTEEIDGQQGQNNWLKTHESTILSTELEVLINLYLYYNTKLQYNR
jgi:hypothetical protein